MKAHRYIDEEFHAILAVIDQYACNILKFFKILKLQNLHTKFLFFNFFYIGRNDKLERSKDT